MDIQYLNNQIDTLMKENAGSVSNSKTTRDILFYQSELRENNISFAFTLNVAEIDPGFAEFSLGKSQFKRSEYQLTWMAKDNEKFQFVLTNIPYKNSKYLLECPEGIQRDIIRILPRFIDQIVIKAKDLAKNTSYQ